MAFVAHANRLGRFRFRHPEGWAQTTVAAAAGPAPSVADARTRLVPTLDVPGAAFQLESVQTASLPAGAAVRVGWRRNSAPDAVTGRVYRDEVVTYLVGAGGTVVRMDLPGRWEPTTSAQLRIGSSRAVSLVRTPASWLPGQVM